MAEHYTANTESVTAWCKRCGRNTQHSVSGNRRGRCLEHEVPRYSKKQLEDRKRRETGEGIGRNIKRQLDKAPQLEGLAPCGDPNCNGCYSVTEILADGMEVHPQIHPPRSDF